MSFSKQGKLPQTTIARQSSIDKVPVDTKRFSGDLADSFHFCLHHRVLVLETAMTAIEVPA